jgi:hypothetical protein
MSPAKGKVRAWRRWVKGRDSRGALDRKAFEFGRCGRGRSPWAVGRGIPLREIPTSHGCYMRKSRGFVSWYI